MNHATPHRYRVVERIAETYDTATLTLEPVDAAITLPVPGQFTMLTAFGVGEVPISVSGDLTHGAPLVHTLRAVGAVTKMLHDTRPGNVVGVRGPFGVGWNLAAGQGRDLVLMAGGIGLAPLRPVLLAALATSSSFGRVALLVGARTPDDLLYQRQMDELSAHPRFEIWTTVDHPSSGWRGPVGVVTRLLDDVELDPGRTEAYVCGPEVMMRFGAHGRLARCPGRLSGDPPGPGTARIHLAGAVRGAAVALVRLRLTPRRTGRTRLPAIVGRSVRWTRVFGHTTIQSH